MFSYRHGFHAGNHADVLKHTVLIAALQHMAQKDTAISVIDTHAGAGLYRLDGDFANTSGEAKDGIARLIDIPEAQLAPALRAYAQTVRSVNQGKGVKTYPGSPFITHSLLRPQDKLRLFELHPTDWRALDGNMAQLDTGKQVEILMEDGFNGVKRFLPPPSRRGFLLCDPSYEMKTDYGRVISMIEDALVRFATGTYAVWYPIIPRQDAHDLPKRLKTIATKAGKGWLHATLTVKGSKLRSEVNDWGNTTEAKRPGLPASGMFLINPPFTLRAALKEALPQMQQLLAQDKNATHSLEFGE